MIAGLRANLRKTGISNDLISTHLSQASAPAPAPAPPSAGVVKPVKPPKPTPPVKPSKPGMLSNQSTGASAALRRLNPPPAPPSRSYVKSPTPTPPVAVAATDIDLDLPSQWYALPQKVPPPSVSKLNHSCLWLSQGNDNQFNLDVRLPELTVAHYVLQWPTTNPAQVTVLVSYTPSPLATAPSKAELIDLSQRFGDYVALWVEKRQGTVIGRGECWDVAHDALRYGCGNHAMVTNYRIHGYPILDVAINDAGQMVYMDPRGQLDLVRRGDVVEITRAKFSGYNVDNEHTAVVSGQDNGVFTIVDQSQGVPVTQRVIDIKTMSQGRLIVYRPMPREWLPELNAPAVPGATPMTA